MRKLEMTRKPVNKGTQWLYEIWSDGVKIDQKKSDREYYAAAVYPGQNKTANWIGRPDLVNASIAVKQGAELAKLNKGFGTELLPCYQDQGQGLILVSGRLYPKTK
jgi:hypothetical protein